MDSVAMLGRVVDEANRIVNNISEDQLDNATGCTEWTVRDMINHITGGATMFAVSAEQGSVPDEQVAQIMGGDNLGDDYKGAFGRASKHALDAFDDPAVLEKIVKLPFGEMPAGVALNIAVFDVATHAADLAKATGQTIEDEGMLETALDMGRQMVGPDLRVPGVFDAEQPAPEGASAAEKLLAFAGRKP